MRYSLASMAFAGYGNWAHNLIGTVIFIGALFNMARYWM